MNIRSWLDEEVKLTYGFRGITQTKAMKRWKAVLVDPSNWFCAIIAVSLIGFLFA